MRGGFVSGWASGAWPQGLGTLGAPLMLKHPKITSSRIQQFLENVLQPALLPSTSPLKIEFCAEPFATESEAKKGDFQVVERGFRYGPAYRTVWFRVTGKVPKEMAGWPIGAVLDVGSERTVWKGNSPWQGDRKSVV